MVVGHTLRCALMQNCLSTAAAGGHITFFPPPFISNSKRGEKIRHMFQHSLQDIPNLSFCYFYFHICSYFIVRKFVITMLDCLHFNWIIVCYCIGKAHFLLLQKCSTP